MFTANKRNIGVEYLSANRSQRIHALQNILLNGFENSFKVSERSDGLSTGISKNDHFVHRQIVSSLELI